MFEYDVEFVRNTLGNSYPQLGYGFPLNKKQVKVTLKNFAIVTCRVGRILDYKYNRIRITLELNV